MMFEAKQIPSAAKTAIYLLIALALPLLLSRNEMPISPNDIALTQDYEEPLPPAAAKAEPGTPTTPATQLQSGEPPPDAQGTVEPLTSPAATSPAAEPTPVH